MYSSQPLEIRQLMQGCGGNGWNKWRINECSLFIPLPRFSLCNPGITTVLHDYLWNIPGCWDIPASDPTPPQKVQEKTQFPQILCNGMDVLIVGPIEGGLNDSHAVLPRRTLRVGLKSVSGIRLETSTRRRRLVEMVDATSQPFVAWRVSKQDPKSKGGQV